MEQGEDGRLELSLLLHLLDHRGHQVRFEADQWTTEFGIFRAFAQIDPLALKTALRTLEITRLIYRRVQYVVGYSEPKLVYSLTPSGHRKALDMRRAEGGPSDGDSSEHDVDGSSSVTQDSPSDRSRTGPSLVDGSDL